MLKACARLLLALCVLSFPAVAPGSTTLEKKAE